MYLSVSVLDKSKQPTFSYSMSIKITLQAVKVIVKDAESQKYTTLASLKDMIEIVKVLWQCAIPKSIGVHFLTRQITRAHLYICDDKKKKNLIKALIFI